VELLTLYLFANVGNSCVDLQCIQSDRFRPVADG